jgi:hypothetical protein
VRFSDGDETLLEPLPRCASTMPTRQAGTYCTDYRAVASCAFWNQSPSFMLEFQFCGVEFR